MGGIGIRSAWKLLDTKEMDVGLHFLEGTKSFHIQTAPVLQHNNLAILFSGPILVVEQAVLFMTIARWYCADNSSSENAPILFTRMVIQLLKIIKKPSASQGQ